MQRLESKLALAPVAPVVALGTGVTGGATRAEAMQASGVVRVIGEKSAVISVSFLGTTGGKTDVNKVVTKSVIGRGAGIAVPVLLTNADVTKLTDGPAYAVAFQKDAAGNRSPNAVVPFSLDTAAPVAPVVALGTGVAGGATRTEATQAAGVVRVSGEKNAVVYVSFIGTTKGVGDNNKVVTKTVIGQGPGVTVPVTLTDADVVKLTDGPISAMAFQFDAARNRGPSSVVPLVIDTVAPVAPVVALGAGVPGGATRAEATQASGVVTVAGSVGNWITVSILGTTKGVIDAAKVVTKVMKLAGSGTPVAVVLSNADVNRLGDGPAYVKAVQSDPAGNLSPVALATLTIDTMSAGQQPDPRPTLFGQQGQYFSWSAPKGWTSTEEPSGSGVDVASPDRRMGAGFVVYRTASGSSTPEAFVDFLMKKGGVASYTIESSNPLPSMESGYPGMPWTVREFVIRYRSAAGVDTRGYMAAAVVNYSFYGFNPSWDGMLTYHAAPVAEWAKASQWLPVIGNSILITNVTQIAGGTSVIPARNNPLENPLIESWRIKGLSDDRISEARRAGMMGYERMQSSNGQTFNVPLDSYVPGVGYYNPNDSGSTKPRADWEILRPATS